MRVRLAVVTLCAGLVASLAPAWAHHSFAAEFDEKKPVHLQGKVTEVEWINPHAWIHIDVAGPDGKVNSWMVECGSPNVMFRRGFTKHSLEEGAEVTIDGYQAKSGQNKANGGSLTFKDGKKLFVGGSNPDTPQDQRQ
jgi:hypothetical protein